jgi:tetratricopeptide (TPR) repeat protein
LGKVASVNGRSEEAVQDYEQALEHLNHLGKDAPSRTVFAAKEGLALTLSLVLGRRLPDAQRLLEEAIALADRDSSIPRVNVATAMSLYASNLDKQGKPSEAEAMARKALAIGRQEDADGMWQAQPLYFLGVLIHKKNPAEATALARRRYEVFVNNLGPDNAQTAIAKILWARFRAVSTGEADEAAKQVLEAIEVVRAQFPSPSMERWVGLSSTVFVLNKAKRFKDAEPLAREMLPIVDANRLAQNDPRRAESWLGLGQALHGEKKEREAAEALKKAAAIYDSAGPDWRIRAESARTLLGEIK